jgi:Flp pilus assembly secretin CpaC
LAPAEFRKWLAVRFEVQGGFAMIPMLRTCLLAAALLPITHSISRAADQEITLKLGAGSTLMLERQFKTVLIGDPDVVDVRAQGDRSVILVPLDLGATNVVFVDEQSIAITNVRVLVTQALTELPTKGVRLQPSRLILVNSRLPVSATLLPANGPSEGRFRLDSKAGNALKGL